MSRARDLAKLGNTNIIAADSDFNVGLGTTASIQYKLDVIGDANFTGVVTATSFGGDGSALTGVAATDNINTNNIAISGIATVGTSITMRESAINVTGVITATSFSGDGSSLTGLPGGLGTAIAASGGGANIYYANKVLAIDTNLTTDVPDTSNIAYTQHQDLAVGSGAELVVSDGDQIVTDILGLSTDLGSSALTGGGGVVRADNFTNRTGGAPTFPDGIKVSAGVVTVSDTTASTTTSTGALVVSGGVGIAGSLHVGENVSVGGTLTYEDVTNIDSVGLITARLGVIATAGRGVEITAGGLNVTAGIATFKNEVDADGGVDIAGGLKVAGITTLNSKLRIDIANGGTAGSGTAEGIFLRNTQETDNNAVTIFGGADDHNNAASAINLINVDHSANYGDISFDTRGSGGYGERLRIDGGGNIGINTNNPNHELTVFGDEVNFRLTHSGSTNKYNALYTNVNGTGVEFNSYQDGTGTRRPFAFKQYTTEVLSITNAGVVGINTTSPLTQLDVRGGITVGHGLIQERAFFETGGSPSGTFNINVLTNGMVYRTDANMAGTFTINLRGDGSTTFNSLMDIGATSVYTFYAGSSNTSYVLQNFQIDSSNITEKWNGGSAPSAATGSGTDVYTFNIMKTADATFTVFATFSNFA